jgi:hypothetical protein
MGIDRAASRVIQYRKGKSGCGPSVGVDLGRVLPHRGRHATAAGCVALHVRSQTEKYPHKQTHPYYCLEIAPAGFVGPKAGDRGLILAYGAGRGAWGLGSLGGLN